MVPYNLNVVERIAGLDETTRGTNRTRGERVVALLHCFECIVTQFILQSKALLHRDALFGGKTTAQRRHREPQRDPSSVVSVPRGICFPLV